MDLPPHPDMKLEPGDYVLFRVSQNAKPHGAFGRLRVRCAELRDKGEPNGAEAGQWLMELYAENGDVVPAAVILNAMARLGLWPVRFTQSFVDALRANAPLGLVADTNTLYNGFLLQALRIRRGQPTHVVVPDQVLQEVQLHRETQKKKGALPERFHRASRALRALSERSGFILHTARPPDAMVRYFGADYSRYGAKPPRESEPDDEGAQGRDAASGDEDIGPSFFRDRLILEVARVVRANASFPVWLLCGDANLAEQAELEGFQVGFAWLPDLPTPLVASAPCFDPYTLRLHFLPVDALLNELTWTLGGVGVQRRDTREQRVFQVATNEKGKRVRVRAVLGDTVQPITSCLSEGESLPWAFTKPQSPDDPIPDSGDTKAHARADKKRSMAPTRRRAIARPGEQERPVPAKDTPAPSRAPGAASLISGLKAVTEANEAGLAEADLPRDVVPYLVALRWGFRRDVRIFSTDRGREIIQDWLALAPDDAARWIAWHRSIIGDLDRLERAQDFLRLLPEGGAEIADLVSAGFGGERIVESQTRLLGVFGLVVRIHGRVWRARLCTDDEAAGLIVAQARSLQPPRADDRSPPVRVDDLYLALTRRTPLSLVDFRAGLLTLSARGWIALGGSAPDVGGSGRAVRVSVLTPAAEGAVMKDVDLGAGDFLVPGQSSQIVRLLVEA